MSDKIVEVALAHSTLSTVVPQSNQHPHPQHSPLKCVNFVTLLLSWPPPSTTSASTLHRNMLVPKDVAVGPLHAVRPLHFTTVSAPLPIQAPAPSFVGTTPSSGPQLRSARHLVLFLSKHHPLLWWKIYSPTLSPGTKNWKQLSTLIMCRW